MSDIFERAEYQMCFRRQELELLEQQHKQTANWRLLRKLILSQKIIAVKSELKEAIRDFSRMYE